MWLVDIQSFYPGNINYKETIQVFSMKYYVCRTLAILSGKDFQLPAFFKFAYLFGRL